MVGLTSAENFFKEIFTAYLKDEIVKTEHPGVFHAVPLGYWETCDARQWGIVENICEKGLRVRSDVSMPIGAELRIRVFCRLGCNFDEFQSLVKISGKEPCWEGGWEAFEYELEWIGPSGHILGVLSFPPG